MTKDEFKSISLGAQIRLARGDLVEVKSIDQEKETITFQYAEHPQIAPPSPKRLGRRIGMVGAPTTRVPIADEATAELEEIGKTPTIVKCSWNELLNATIL